MSARDVRKILLRIQTDDDFYQKLLCNPDECLAEYSLTPEERNALVKHDRRLYNFLVPGVATVPEQAVSIVITITGEHDWFNVTKMRPAEELPPEVFEKISELAQRVLGAQGAERVEMLITLLKLLDGRQN